MMCFKVPRYRKKHVIMQQHFNIVPLKYIIICNNANRFYTTEFFLIR